MNGDSVPLLLDEILRSYGRWTSVLDYAFYVGVGYGIFKGLQLTYEILSGIRTYFVPIGRAVRRDLREQFGKWAVITGATSDIGVAFAYEFASRGMNVVLISRSYEKLLPIVSTIQTEYNVQAYGVHADFFLGQQVFTEIEQALLADKLDIGIIVNTNPIHYDHPQYFSQIPPSRLWQIVNVNVAATTMMTHVVLPRMLSRRRGAVINVSTCLSSSVSPLQSCSLASKVYVDFLGQALHEECCHKGIIIQTLTPWKLSQDSTYPFFIPSHKVYVQHALQTLGVSSRCCGYWPHEIVAFLHRMLPSVIWSWLQGQRNRYLRQKCLIEVMSRNPDHLFARKPRKQSFVVVPPSVNPSSYPPSPIATAAPRPTLSDNVTTTSRRTASLNTPSSDQPPRPSTLQRTYSRVMVVPSVVRAEVSPEEI